MTQAATRTRIRTRLLAECRGNWRTVGFAQRPTGGSWLAWNPSAATARFFSTTLNCGKPLSPSVSRDERKLGWH
jgi:hypothetical protein